MRVRYVYRNSCEAEAPDHVRAYYDQIYDRGGGADRTYRPGLVGFESTVYAIELRAGIPTYYIRDPASNTLYHAAGICFNTIDSATSELWHYRCRYVPNRSKLLEGEKYMLVLFAIKEWVEDDRFYERYLDGEKKYRSTMEEYMKLMDAEYD